MKRALVVIDFINDIVDLKGKIPSCAQQVIACNTIEHANSAIAWARKNHIPCIFIKVGFNNDYLDLPRHSPMFGKTESIGALNLKSWGTQFHKDLAITEDDLVICKPRVNPFHNTQLDSVLRANAITDVYFCGVSTTWAIQSAVRDAHDRDYQVHIITDACAAATEEEHQSSLTMLSRIATLHSSKQLKE
ncbi:isochorismatase [Photobacterium leiognathi subsp. mandapamensis]|nr:isochorismatase [Photobacterium leiognathi subsp. mandapamensis]